MTSQQTMPNKNCQMLMDVVTWQCVYIHRRRARLIFNLILQVTVTEPQIKYHTRCLSSCFRKVNLCSRFSLWSRIALVIFRSITYVALTNNMADTCVRFRQTRVQARPVSGLGKMIAQCTRIAYVVWRGLRLLTKWRKLASAMRQLA